MTNPRSGIQHTIRAGDYTAVIASVGASLRMLRHGERDLVMSFEADEVRPRYSGATLAPWPNRVVDGRYAFDGVQYQLALTEPGRGHALHGLATWLEFDATDKSSDHVTLSAVIPAETGYPFPIRLDVHYAVDGDGLRQSVTATNLGAIPAPYGVAPHPYLVAGEGPVDGWMLELPAAEVLTVTPDRLVPVSVASVQTLPELDFRAPRLIGATEIDHAYTELPTGAVTVRMLAADGTGVAMAWGEECPWVQIHTTDRDGAPGHRGGLAVEPMTCPPDAFNSGVDLVVLEPGASHTAAWSISAITA